MDRIRLGHAKGLISLQILARSQKSGRDTCIGKKNALDERRLRIASCVSNEDNEGYPGVVDNGLYSVMCRVSMSFPE